MDTHGMMAVWRPNSRLPPTPRRRLPLSDRRPPRPGESHGVGEGQEAAHLRAENGEVVG